MEQVVDLAVVCHNYLLFTCPDHTIRGQLDILKGRNSERFLSLKVFIPKIFFLSRRVNNPNFEITTLLDKNLWNNYPSG